MRDKAQRMLRKKKLQGNLVDALMCRRYINQGNHWIIVDYECGANLIKMNLIRNALDKTWTDAPWCLSQNKPKLAPLAIGPVAGSARCFEIPQPRWQNVKSHTWSHKRHRTIIFLWLPVLHSRSWRFAGFHPSCHWTKSGSRLGQVAS